MMLAVVAIVGVGVAVALVLALKLKDVRVQSERHAARATTLAERLDTLRHTSRGDKARLEQVLIQLRGELAGMEADLEICNDPYLVRERLRKLLLSTPGAANRNPLTVVPPGPTTSATPGSGRRT